MAKEVSSRLGDGSARVGFRWCVLSLISDPKQKEWDDAGSGRERRHAPGKTTRPLQRFVISLREDRPLSGQSEREQARAQEQEARRSYRQKPIRYEVVVAHSAPANFNARPNLLKLSVRARWSR
jgi:hypothetical protein